MKVNGCSRKLMNRLTRVTDAYAYAAGNLTRVTDARDNFTIFEYDSQNRLVKTTDPLGKFETFSYDANGNLIRKTETATGAVMDYILIPIEP